MILGFSLIIPHVLLPRLGWSLHLGGGAPEADIAFAAACAERL